MTDTPRRGKPFAPGPDPRRSPGKPKGCRSRSSVLAEQLLEADVQAVVAALVKRARAGDVPAASFIVGRLVPPRKDRPMPEGLDLPVVERVEDLPGAITSIIGLAAGGTLDLDQAERLAGLLAKWMQAVEAADLAARVERLEARLLSRGLP